MVHNNTDSAGASIEDNYTEYLNDECGYAYDMADRMTQPEIAMQDLLVDRSAAELRALEGKVPDDANEFILWTLARAWEQAGDLERYFELCAQLLDGADEHRLIISSEISRLVARQRAEIGDFSRARQRLRTHLQRWPEDDQAEQLAALVEYLQRSAARVSLDAVDAADISGPDEDSALHAFAQRFPDDAEIRYEIAEDLWHFQRPDAASTWLDRAREIALEYDPATLVDIELLDSRISPKGPS